MTSFFLIIWATSWQNQQNWCASSEDSDQPGHPPSLTSALAVRMKKARALSYPLGAQQRLWSALADAQADLSLRWAHSHFVGFVMRGLILAALTLHTFSLLGQLVFCIYTLFRTLKLLDSGSDVRGFKPPHRRSFFCAGYFWNYNIHDIFSILIFNKWSDRFYLYFL